MEGDFVPATALTQTLTRVFRALAEGHIDRKNATSLTRVAGTLLKSIDASSREFQSAYGERYSRQLIRNRYNGLPEYVPPPLLSAYIPRAPISNASNPNSSNSGGNNSGSNQSGS